MTFRDHTKNAQSKCLLGRYFSMEQGVVAQTKQLWRKESAPPPTVRLGFRVTEQEMDAFRALSGDTNPIHHDADYCARRGFARPVVYGGLLVAQISRLLGTRLPGPGCVWRSLDLRFRSPLYVEEAAQLTAAIRHSNEDLGVYELEFRIMSGDRRIADGEAAAIVERERGNAGN